MVEMVFRTSNGKCYKTIEEAEQAEKNIKKIEKMKQKMEFIIGYYKKYSNDTSWIGHYLNDVAEYAVEHFDEFQEIMKDDK